MLALAGGAVGVLLATWMSGALAPALSRGGDPTEILTRLDARVLAFAIATAGAAAILFGLLPAFRATDLQVSAGLQTAGRAIDSRLTPADPARRARRRADCAVAVAGGRRRPHDPDGMEPGARRSRVRCLESAAVPCRSLAQRLRRATDQRHVQPHAGARSIRARRDGGVALEPQAHKQLRHDRDCVTHGRGRSQARKRRAAAVREDAFGLAPCRRRALFHDARGQVRARPDVHGRGRGQRPGRGDQSLAGTAAVPDRRCGRARIRLRIDAADASADSRHRRRRGRPVHVDAGEDAADGVRVLPAAARDEERGDVRGPDPPDRRTRSCRQCARSFGRSIRTCRCTA